MACCVCTEENNILDTITVNYEGETPIIISYCYWDPGRESFTLNPNNIPLEFKPLNIFGYFKIYVTLINSDESNNFNYIYYDLYNNDIFNNLTIEYPIDDFSDYTSITVTVVSFVQNNILLPTTKYNYVLFGINTDDLYYMLYKDMLFQMGNENITPFSNETRFAKILVPSNTFFGTIVYVNNLILFTFSFRTRPSVANNTFTLISLTNGSFIFDTQTNKVVTTILPEDNQNLIFFSVIFY